MKYRSLVIVFLITAITGSAAGQERNMRENASFTAAGQLRYGSARETPPPVAGQKSPLGIVMSVIVPGTGEIYAGAWLKGLAFLTVEAGLWTGYALWTAEGRRIEDDFHIFADANWDEAEYWVSVAEEAGISGVDIDNYDNFLPELREAEHDIAHFTHTLPETKTQQYYEMIGKYDQFKAGWNDYVEGGPALTGQRDNYESMRHNSNVNFKRGSYCVMAALFNHVLSGLDTAWTIRRYNRSVEAGFRFGLRPVNAELMPMVGLNLQW